MNGGVPRDRSASRPGVSLLDFCRYKSGLDNSNLSTGPADKDSSTCPRIRANLSRSGPRRVVVFLLATCSFTSQGDTVVTFSAETDGVIECALRYGRKLEVFVAVGDKAEEVANRVEEAWEAPWRESKFTVSTTVYIFCFYGIYIHGCPVYVMLSARRLVFFS